MLEGFFFNAAQDEKSEPAPTSAPWRMDVKRSGNNFLLDSSCQLNHGGYITCLFLLPP
jgi:hypothetical protein